MGEGMFISFEGGDGVGKSTQVKKLAEWLRNQGHHVVVTREPGGSEGGELIRDILVNGTVNRWSPLTELLLMFAARTDHLEKKILPALARDEIVITDRFVDSSMAYQGIAGAVGEEKVCALAHISLGGRMPDLTFVLMLSQDIGLERAHRRGSDESRFEKKGKSYQANVHAAFKKIAADNPSRCVLIDASRDIEMIATEIQNIVSEKIAARSCR